MSIKKIDIELTRAKLADAYITGQSWNDINLVYPEIDQSLFIEVAKEIDIKLAASTKELRPKELYKGLGIEIDLCDQGLFVNTAYKDCPAAKLGIKAGDIITKVNFESVTNLPLSTSLSKLRNSNYEEGIILEVMRGKETITLGYGLNIQTKVIDAKKKYPINFTALVIGKRLMMSTGSKIEVDSYAKLPIKKRVFEMSR